MLVLTFSTGVVDAVGFLGLDRVFTGNMTGNVVILGMGAAGADDLPVVGPLVALVAFMAGALLAGRTLRSVPAGWTGRTTALLGLVVALLVASAVVDLVLEDPARLVLLALTAALGAAMGLQAQAARHLAVKDVTTVVVTSTLTGLSADSWFGGRTGQPWARRAGAVALICAGAATGALLLGAGIAAGIALSAALTLVVAVLGHRLRVRDA
jgi:uncharacterized membrane protein YoaK (UPF0700 family)